MKKIIKLTESELVKIVNKVILEQKVDEGIFDGIKNAYRGLKGMKRGFGTDYFQNMSRLENLIKKLKTKVSSLGMPQERKDALIALIDNSLYHFKKYSNVNDQILTQIKTLNLDSWK